MSRRVRVRVPATSANLGPGFDTLGLALDLHDVVVASAGDERPDGADLHVAVTGIGADAVPRDERHLVVRSMLACFGELGVAPPRPLAVTCRNAIPHGRGLGSSAAAIVAGVLAAAGLAAADLDLDAVLDLASRLEGHPDNVAPCLLGGFTIAWSGEEGRYRAVTSTVHPDVRPVICVPSSALSTDTARGLLPGTVSHADAARNAGRAALLVEAVTRRPELLLDATEDRLHQSYRGPAMPESLELVERLREHGLAAVVSGAGPSVLVLANGDEAGRVSALVSGWDVRLTAVDTAGATVVDGAEAAE